MTREQYESLSAVQLKELARARGLRVSGAMRKSAVVELMLSEDAKKVSVGAAQEQAQDASGEKPAQEKKKPREGQARHGEKGKKSGHEQPSVQEPERTGKAESPERADRPEKPERAGKADRPERAEKADRPERSDRSERTEKAEKSDRPERSERAEKADRSDRSERTDKAERPERPERTDKAEKSERPERAEKAEKPERSERAEKPERPPMEISQLDSGMKAHGYLDVMADGYGFIRSNQFESGDNDVYVSPSQIRKFSLRTGDLISGNTRIRTAQEKFSALLYLTAVNGMPPSEAKRPSFEEMTPIFPNERLRLERGPKDISMRIVDLISPVGKGQRGMIVSQPKAGKTTLLKDMAKSLLRNNPEIHLIILLIDERPEEVTDIREAIVGDNVEVVYSTFDELPEHHKKVAEMVLGHAKRLVEQKRDVVILLDSITRLARACNMVETPSGRTLSGGLDPAALHMPKRFFGAARNIREGGSLTVLATALVETGSRMDDVIYEEFKGTGNMELVLDRKLSEKRVFPAIDIPKSSTRREDLLLDKDEQDAVYIMRRALNGMKADDAVESILNLFTRTRDNREFVRVVKLQKYI